MTEVRKQTHSWSATCFPAGTPGRRCDSPHFTVWEKALRSTIRCLEYHSEDAVATSDTEILDSFDPPAPDGPQPTLLSLSLGQTGITEVSGALPWGASLALRLED